MKVVILCGGLGTRLKEETKYRPKPMAEISSIPCIVITGLRTLYYVLDRYFRTARLPITILRVKENLWKVEGVLDECIFKTFRDLCKKLSTKFRKNIVIEPLFTIMRRWTIVVYTLAIFGVPFTLHNSEIRVWRILL